ncbi:acyl-CoA carboxylase subunit epsilon [Streptomyces sp. AP-93]|uniref:acyl-CoA carboxylase subunit epsilon n=1 Tax=Streptomyces sp. AP-93 TaxID=2929048 RepID=UPI001FAE9C2B|nr:acyl-CoA carboxylase subunit epsilon [Streptomyces sp. AP-93]MCJ0871737.1 acyl-CoA carboxylase subunit epsilon [Streptomyces sp. AP-93]
MDHSDPLFTVLRGVPDAAELAALTAVLLSRSPAAGPPAPPPRRAPWIRPHRHVAAGSWVRAAGP